MASRKDVAVPEPYQNYVNCASDDDLLKAIKNSTKRFWKLVRIIPKKKFNYAYAEGKWTIRQVVQHIIDVERVFVLRALWFTRKDASAQPGFDENTWAENARVTDRKWKDMIEEFLALRAANELFFASLNDDELMRTGTSGSKTVSTLAFGFISAGHLEHHINILEQRYLPEPPNAPKKKKK